jgi:putative ABC transport system permease protein
MGFRDLLHETWSSLSSNKARSFLTILGIVIGIASVIAMTSLIGGMQNMLMGELGLFQARVVQMYAFGSDPIDQDDLDIIAQQFPEYEVLTGTASGYVEISTSNTMIESQVTGVDENYAAVTSIKIEKGRNITADDQRRATKVLVIGRGLVLDLFGSEDASCLGETVRVGPNRESYTVVGVVEGGGTTMNFRAAIMPLRTLQMRVTGISYFDSVYGLAREGADVPALAANTQTFLIERLGFSEDEVYVYSMQEILDQVEVIMAAFSLMLTAIASISLFVGGIGIMNMMLTTVTERTREIGLRKSLGAHTADITRQFLAESIALCLIGGLFGIIFGYLMAMALAGIVSLVQPDVSFAPALGISAISIAVGVCALLGIVFGFYPARRAAKMDPVESLRYQ